MKYGYISGDTAQVKQQKSVMRSYGINGDALIFGAVGQVLDKLEPNDVIYFSSLTDISSKIREINEIVEQLWEKEIDIQIISPEIRLSRTSEAGSLLKELMIISRSETRERLTAARQNKKLTDPNFHTGPSPKRDVGQVVQYRKSHTTIDTARHFEISISTVKRYLRNAKNN
ncbi:recombinase family protein [Ligilactobacillus equi]|uniref:Putative resolvase n=1 Tax=Ligilactobacillus equi DPC 6820 TaxID=1392007 RepID=V7HX14_9LACO|nr:recombinase family protein [Ligilactobacillus equi]ETA73753.1 putative resolvase [Ligilactobacillus equi DPC 6820]